MYDTNIKDRLAFVLINERKNICLTHAFTRKALKIMFNKIKPYMGSYVEFTYAALAVMFLALIASAVPFFMVYRIIKPLIEGETLSAGYYAVHIAVIFACELVYAILYVQGLKYSHISAYNTLKNIRISLQKKLERQPLGTIQDMGNGKIKKLFTDDIDQVELHDRK